MSWAVSWGEIAGEPNWSQAAMAAGTEMDHPRTLIERMELYRHLSARRAACLAGGDSALVGIGTAATSGGGEPPTACDPLVN
jgi:hypothetical protein